MIEAHSLTRYSLLFLVASALACHSRPTARGGGPRPPVNEVWVTEAEANHMGLETTVVANREIVDRLPLSGTVTFDDSRVSHVFSPIAGRITRIEAQLGDRVQRSEALAQISSPDLGSISADYDKARADYAASHHDLLRQRELETEGAASHRDVEVATETYRRATAELSRAREHMSLLSAGTVDRVTQSYTIRSPIEGDVIARGATPGLELQGQYAGGSSPELFTIGRLDRVWIMADVYEMDFANVRIGASAVVHVVAFPAREYSGRVEWVSGFVDHTTRTARIRCSVENPDQSLRPGMFATVIVGVPSISALSIPRSAALRVSDQTIVFVERGRSRDNRTRFESWPVLTDEGSNGPWLEVRGGLAAGDRVVSHSGIQLLGLLRESAP